MAILFNKLGVPRNVRLFFEPYYHILPNGSFYFPFGDEAEHFNGLYHFVPSTVVTWVAGDGPLLFISFSAMEAIAFLSVHHHAYPDFKQLRFIAIGNYLTGFSITGRKISLVFGNDILGRLTDIKASLLLRNKDASLFYRSDEIFEINGHQFEAERLSLNTFETALGVRSGIRTIKPRGFNTFLEQLKYQNL